METFKANFWNQLFASCPAAAALSPWSKWSKCQAQSQTRTRSCTSTDKTLPCGNDPLQETQLCESEFNYYVCFEIFIIVGVFMSSIHGRSKTYSF